MASARYDKQVSHGNEDRQTPSQHAATWAAQPRQHRSAKRAKTVVASLALAGTLGGAVWHSTGHYMSDQAYQAAAHNWAELETCLLGPRRQAGVAASERYRRIARDTPVRAHRWPQHCQGYALGLDAALQDPAIATTVGPFPHAAKTLALLGTSQEDPSRLDRLWAQLGSLDLPTTSHPTTAPLAPRAQQPVLRIKQLQSLGRLNSLSELAWRVDSRQGQQLRLLMPGNPSRICSSPKRASKGRFALRCRSLAIGNQNHAEFRLASAAPDAGDVVFRVDDRGRRGYFDGNTGRSLFRPPSDFSQALVPTDRSIRILHAVLDEHDPSRVDSWRVAELRRGKPLRNSRVRLPRNAVPILTEEGVLFWPNRVATRLPIYAAAWKRSKSGRLRLRKAESLGTITSGSSPMARCNSTAGHGLLLQGETPGAPSHLLLSNENGWSRPIELENGDNILSLHCRARDVALLRQQSDNTLGVDRCTPEGCKSQGVVQLPAKAGKQLAVGVRNQHVLFAWTDNAGLVRLQHKRVGSSVPAVEKTATSLLMDTKGHGGLDIRDIQFISVGEQTVLLLRSKDKRLYPVAIDASATPKPVPVLSD